MSTQLLETGRSVCIPSSSKIRCSAWCKRSAAACARHACSCVISGSVSVPVNSSNSLCFLSDCRHVKGRVLVALADGTLAIFHRSEGTDSLSLAQSHWRSTSKKQLWLEFLKKKTKKLACSYFIWTIKHVMLLLFVPFVWVWASPGAVVSY